MGNTKVDLKQLEEFRDRVQKVADEEQQRAFMEACAKELAARLLAKVIKRTPVGDYSGEAYECKGKDMNFTHMGNKVSGKTGGTLRRAGCLDTTCLPCPRKKSAMRHQGFFGKSSISG